jgi:hypothetical protein
MSTEFQKCGCPHCSTEIEFDAADSGRECNCPACGKVLKLPPPVGKVIFPVAEPPPQIVYVQTPQPQTIYVTEKPKTGCLTQIIAAFFIFMLVCFIIGIIATSDNNPSPVTQNKPMVTAEISVAGGNLIVSNTGKETWKSVNVYVNSEPPDGYGCRLEDVKPLASKAIPLTEFVKPDGERFDPVSKKVLNACIGGNDYTYEKFSF